MRILPMMFMFESIFDHKFNISDLKNNVDVDIFTHIYAYLHIYNVGKTLYTHIYIYLNIFTRNYCQT